MKTKTKRISLAEVLAARGIGSGLRFQTPEGREVECRLSQIHYYKTGKKKGRVSSCTFAPTTAKDKDIVDLTVGGRGPKPR